jgi:hypothetical protein
MLRVNFEPAAPGASPYQRVERQRQSGDDPGGEERGTDGQHGAEDDERRGEGCGDGPRVHPATLSEV